MHRLALSKYQRNGLKILLAVILAALIFLSPCSITTSTRTWTTRI